MNLLQSIIRFFIGLFKKSEGTTITTKVEPKRTINTSSSKDLPPEVIIGDSKVESEGAKLGPVKEGPTLHTINNSKNHPYYTQRNNEINPNQACSVTSMTMGLLYNGLIYKNGERWYNKNGIDLYELNKDSLPKTPYNQFEDNLIYFTRHDTKVLEYYSRTYPNLYDDWVKEMDDAEKRGLDLNKYAAKSYPPNELHLVLSFSVNRFIGIENCTKYETQGIETIIKKLKNGESLVVSGVFEGLNHVVCVVGLQYEEGTEKVVNFIIDDPWYRTLHYKDKKTGDDSCITADEFMNCVKPQNNKEKACHIFYKR